MASGHGLETSIFRGFPKGRYVAKVGVEGSNPFARSKIS